MVFFSALNGALVPSGSTAARKMSESEKKYKSRENFFEKNKLPSNGLKCPKMARKSIKIFSRSRFGTPEKWLCGLFFLSQI